MRQVNSLSGQELRDMVVAATEWLEKNASEIDDLNVFPVPDGDTGTNMLLTMRSTLEEAYRAPDRSTSAVAEAIAKGALMGARGNSGVILSQIWHGLAKGLAGKESCTGKDLAEALLQASADAYKGMSNPVEGTILTVVREAASAAKTQADSGSDDIVSIMDTVVNTARESVANTPNLLPVLREAGVVDAGGQGLHTILEGALHYLKGETEEFQSSKPGVIISDMAQLAKTPQMIAADENPYGYCTSFIIKGQELDPEKLGRKLKKKGESLIVVGDQSTIRVHIHTLDPGGIIHMATSLGTVHQVSIQNMDEQHEGFVEMQKERMVVADIVVVAVVSGDGLADVFTSLGAVVVPGGRTMNPSTKDLLQAVKSVASDKIIILPDNKNVIPAARQVRSLTDKTIKVLATTTIPQGIAALLAFNTEVDLETNVAAMKKAQSAVRSIAITQAARSVRLVGLHIKRKQPIGFLDGDLVAASDSATGALNEVLAKLDLSDAEIITIYYRGDEERVEVGSFMDAFREQYPHLQIELVWGGQPHYHYIVSVE
ncbi:MAG: DAK2 domain-containing protein [Chloroflexi bacterium]|nr:DAK2 domain-containing protein [Chloroflexota bacterium]